MPSLLGPAADADALDLRGPLDRRGGERGRGLGICARSRRSWAVLALVGLACTGGVPALPDLEAPVGGFSTGIAHAHLERLRELTPRDAGGEADVHARTYLERALTQAGVPSSRFEGSAGRVHLVASLPGRSSDRILVIVPYALLGPASEVDDSGLALALELARALATTPRSYAIEFAFADVRPAPAPKSAVGAVETASGATDTFAATRARLVASGHDLLAVLRGQGRMEEIRAVLVLETRAGRDVRIARDLRSHPVLRSIFQDAAERLGQGAAFPRSATWSAPSGLQDAWYRLGFGRILTLADQQQTDPTQAGAGPDRDANPEADTSWAGLGPVVYEGLGQLMGRFERIDAFAPPDR